MPELADKDHCTGCMACVDACPQNALDFYVNDEGFYSITLTERLCVNCKICEKACPVLSISSLNKFQNPIPYAAWSPNDQVRMQSASGGAFAELAIFVLQNGGVVAGAALTEKIVHHIAITTPEDIHKLQNSKYIQSNTKGIYKKTKKFLKAGKLVLFSGTPCQIAGLRTYLGNTPYIGKLLTSQIVCHGVPSNKILDIFEKNNGEIKKIISFRSKVDGWGKSQVFVYADVNNKIQMHPSEYNLFSKLYGVDLLLRRSCYNCMFFCLKGLADISLADYWGNTSHQNEQFKGISLVIAHSNDGKELLEKANLIIHQTTWLEALPANPRIFTGKNWLFYHPARFFLKFHLNYLPNKIQVKIFSNKIELFDLYLFVYKIINKILHIKNRLSYKILLRNAFEKINQKTNNKTKKYLGPYKVQ